LRIPNHRKFATFRRLQNLKQQRVVMLEQRFTVEEHRSHIAVAVFYATSVLVTSLGLAILITGASVAYAISQSFR
jgi:hypothetical protein